MKYKNPIIPGFNPDPSIVLHAGTYYLVTSSFHIFPGLPIYASKNLQSWTQIGNAISRPSQLSLAAATTRATGIGTDTAMIATAGLWAPTIRFHSLTNKFYILCTNCVRTGAYFTKRNFIITCHSSDILACVWSDPIYFDFDVIDPSIFFDDGDGGEGGKGKVYVQGCVNLVSRKEGEEKTQPSCTLMQVEVEVETGRILQAPKEIWKGFKRVDTEGPHIYQKDGWYYLLAAEGGTFEHHLLSIARSRSIWGPYESYEHNPIMTADGTDEYIQNTGHGDLFQDTECAWWAVVLAVRNENGTFPLGRETFLTPVEWPENGWPRIAQPTMVFERESKVAVEEGSLSGMEEHANLMHEMVYIRQPDLEDYAVSADTKSVSLRAGTTDISSFDGVVSFVGRRQTALECFATATLIIEPKVRNLRAGLVLYKDSFRHAEIYLDFAVGRIVVDSLNGARKSETDIKVASLVLDGSIEKVEFRINATKERYAFSFRKGGGGVWMEVLEIGTGEMTARDFTGTLFGVFACGDEETRNEVVRFEEFEQVVVS